MSLQTNPAVSPGPGNTLITNYPTGVNRALPVAGSGARINSRKQNRQSFNSNEKVRATDGKSID